MKDTTEASEFDEAFVHRVITSTARAAEELAKASERAAAMAADLEEVIAHLKSTLGDADLEGGAS